MRRLLAAALLSTTAACITDVKGASCGPLDAYPKGDDLYCPDPDAPADCIEVRDAIIDAFETCAGAAFDEEGARAAADEALDCDHAVATTTDAPSCLDALAEPTCQDDLQPELPETCQGAVLIDASKETDAGD